MDGDMKTLQRKISNRKRSGEKQCKTPKRTRQENGGCQRPTLFQPGWIQNSFINPSSVRYQVQPKTTATVPQSKQQGLMQNNFDNEGIAFSPQTASPKGRSLHRNLTSTPVTKQMAKVDRSDEKIAHSHDSFNDSDSAFAILDLESLDTEGHNGISPRRSSRKTPSVYRRPLADNGKGNSSKAKQKSVHKTPRKVLYSDSDKSSRAHGFDDLICDSDDSLFNDTLPDMPLENDTYGSIIDGTPQKTQSRIPAKCGVLLSSQYDKEMTIFTQRDIKPEIESLVDLDCTSPSLSPTGSPPSIDKGKCIAFKAVSGSQLSFEEEDGKEIVQGNKSHLGGRDATGMDSHNKEPESTVYSFELNGASDKSNGKNQGLVVCGTSLSPPTPVAHLVTPATAQSRLLKDRFLKRLVNSDSPKTPGSRLAQLKAQNLQKVLLEAEEEMATATEFDVGPFYGLPSKVPEILERERKIKTLYNWQHECLTLNAVKEGRNLIYSLPTSGGKTLVAEILMFRELLCKKKDSILILPFVAIVQEKVKTLSPFALDLNFVVEEYAASKGQIPPRKKNKRKTIFIATIEKASSLINSLIELERLSEIGLVVVDELHMLGEGGGRGAILEMTLAKLMQASGNTQIIGMSATLSNIGDLCQFLEAEVYSNDFRPVELREYVKVEDTIYEVDHKTIVPDDRLRFSRVTTFKYDSEKTRMDPDHLAGLVQEVIPQHSCLVFCPTKKNCENVAELLCKNLPREIMQVKKNEKHILLQSLWREGNGEICPVLRRTVPYGVAYHHSGLTMDERRIIEEAYLDGVLCLLTCTSTLAAGVNLPAKRVILRSPYVAANFLSRSQYKQMVGRAGRAGLDTSGESILILPKKDRTKVLDLVSGPCDFCRSSLLYENYKGIRALLLTTIGLKITPTLQSVANFLQKTLCYIQREHLGVDVLAIAQQALQQLLDMDLILQTVESFSSQGQLVAQEFTLDVTRLGRAVYKGSIEIDRGPQLYADLRQAQESLVVANYLHLLYLVTPYDMVGNVRPDWMTYLDQISCLEGDELRILNLIGVPESYIAKRASGQRFSKSVDEYVVNRFYLTMILYNLWKQRSIWEVSTRFRVPRGQIQNILNGASTFAICTAHFCQELEEFWAYQDLFTNFVKKLSFCFMMDLIPLLEIPGVKAGRARQLYNAGFKNLQHVAHSDPKTLVDAIEHMPKKVASAIITAAKVLLSDKVEALEEEAEQMKAAPTANSKVVETDKASRDTQPKGAQLQ